MLFQCFHLRFCHLLFQWDSSWSWIVLWKVNVNEIGAEKWMWTHIWKMFPAISNDFKCQHLARVINLKQKVHMFVDNINLYKHDVTGKGLKSKCTKKKICLMTLVNLLIFKFYSDFKKPCHQSLEMLMKIVQVEKQVWLRCCCCPAPFSLNGPSQESRWCTDCCFLCVSW